MDDLAPAIFRQRLIIEGKCSFLITDEQIKKYLKKLSEVLDMKTLIEPITHHSEKFGWAGWVHWETSGCHFYTWEEPFPFFSSDIYTCKEFDVKTAVEFTKNFFNADKVVFKNV